MARVTRNVSTIKSAYTKSGSPNTAFATNANTAYRIGPESGSSINRMFFGLDSWPSSLKRNRLYDVEVMLYMQIGSSIAWV